ncbi:MAG: YcbK family protein [Burkholderiaceae bacterium]|nr:YcbK family protein [Burkholderiaceae bacterium]
MKSERRAFMLRAALAGAALPATIAVRLTPACASSVRPPHRVSGVLAPPRELWITRPEAQESIRAVYWAGGILQTDGYCAINRIYRDLRAGAQRPIAPALLHLNYAMQRAVAGHWSPRPMILLSGFRTPHTNRLVGGVEPNVHFAGEADDYIYPGLSFEENLQLARLFQFGGLGVYPDRGSLHKDLGPARTWVEYGHARAATVR